MKKAISNRDLERIAERAGVGLFPARRALALEEDVPAELVARIEAAARDLNYAITMRDRVAMAAGVSIATVNRTYRPDARDRVRSDYVARVEAAAARLGYVPDIAARHERTNNSHIIVLSVSLHDLEDPFRSALLQHLCASVNGCGLHPVIAPVLSGHLLPDIALSSVASAVLLFDDRHTRRRLQALAAAQRPVVLVGRYPGVSCVSADWTPAFRALTRHAIKRQYHVLHLDHLDTSLTCAAKLEGALAAIASSSHDDFEVHLTTDPGIGLEEVLREWRCGGALTAAKQLEAVVTRSRALLVDQARDQQKALTPEAILADLERLAPDSGHRVALLGQSGHCTSRVLSLIEEGHPEWRVGDVVGLGANEDLPACEHAGITSIAVDLESLAAQALELVRAAIAGEPAREIRAPTTVHLRSSL